MAVMAKAGEGPFSALRELILTSSSIALSPQENALLDIAVGPAFLATPTTRKAASI
jgi:hypothetical protein